MTTINGKTAKLNPPDRISSVDKELPKDLISNMPEGMSIAKENAEELIKGSSDSVATDSSSGSNSSSFRDTGVTTSATAGKQKQKTLKDRSRVPPGMVVAGMIIFSCVYSSNFASMFFTEVIPQLHLSVSYVNQHVFQRSFGWILRGYSCAGDASAQNPVCANPSIYTYADWAKYFFGFALVASIYYVLLYKPLSAGMWGPTKRATRHVLHRYMGLLFIIQYSYAWSEFILNYDEVGQHSYFPVTIALNGITQSISAYFSFKVLPDLDDAGYYSDKAVLSRNFVFENSFYQLLSVFGSVFYHDNLRANMNSCLLGRGVILLFCFFPYVFVRTWFPITRFKDAGSSMAGRSKINERFYKIGTSMVKFFYLWAKYFLGFFINWYVFMGKAQPQEMKLIRGMFLLNVGTVSISIFLHTLRFKKVLPAKLTFSIYLAQIYATFSAVPSAYAMFSAHPKLGALTLVGLICNMTRNRFIHFIWCVGSLALMSRADIDW